MLEKILELAEWYDLTLLHPETKAAFYREWQRKLMDRDLLVYHYRRARYNIAIRMKNGVMVIDYDGGSEPDFSNSIMVCKSRRGYHDYQRHALRNQKSVLHPNGEPVDYKFSGYVVCPPSIVKDHEYTWIKGPAPPHELPLFDAGRLPAKPLFKPKSYPGGNGKINNLDAYCRKIESVMGANGNKGMMRVMFILAENCGTFEEAIARAMKWNQSGAARPEWSIEEITRGLQTAWAKKGKA